MNGGKILKLARSVEALWLEIKPFKSKTFLVCFVYCPPNSAINWTENFEHMLETSHNEGKELLLLGDFNIDLSPNAQIPKSWTDLLQLFSLSQLIQEPTRETKNSSKLIDHIYVTCTFKNNISAVGVPKFTISDHYPVCITLKTNVNYSKKHKHICIQYRDYKHFVKENFISDLYNSPLLNNIDQVCNPQNAVSLWINTFQTIYDKHVPIKRKRVKHFSPPCWINADIKSAMRQRDLYKRNGNETSYRYWRNKVTSKIYKAKKNYFSSEIEKGKQSQNSIWKILRNINPKSLNSLVPDKIFDENTQTYVKDTSDLCTLFNNYFSNCIENLAKNATFTEEPNFNTLKSFVDDKVSTDYYFSIPNLSEVFVFEQLTHLDESKACGLDNINAHVLKISAPIISKSLTQILNKCVTACIFPNEWKISKVIPLHKSGKKDSVNNYRPISILPTLSKILERHIHNCISEYLSEFNLIHDSQSGFRKLHSCETALVHLTESWRNSIDDGKLVGCVMLDFRKAFDMIDHNLLIQKLGVYKFHTTALNLFKSYLFGRQQIVKLSGKISNPQFISTGVPQGSILGPLLFIMYLNDLALSIQHCSVTKFADDATISICSKSVNEIECSFHDTLKNIEMWCSSNHMLLNPDKSKFLLLGSRHNLRTLNNFSNKRMSITLSGIPLQQTKCIKLLGIYINETLTWQDHIDNICAKISKLLGILRKFQNYLDLKTRKLFYHSYILPHMDYCRFCVGNLFLKYS